jgi:hypothetical protein
MAIEVLSIVIVIAIGEVPLVASVEVRAATVPCSTVVDIAVATPNPGPFAAFDAASRTIAASQTWAATVTAAPKRGSAATVTSAPNHGSASAAITAAASAGTAAATTPTTPASAASAALADEIDKVGACVGRGLDVQHWRRIGDSSAQHQATGESAHCFPIDTHHDLHLI